MCVFTSQAITAEQIAREYNRRTNGVDAARIVLLEVEKKELEAQRKDPRHQINIYAVRLTDGMTVSPAYAEPIHVIINESEELQVMRWGLIPRGTSLEKREKYKLMRLYKNARSENMFTKWPWKFVTHQRCIIPVTGFFEPHQYPSGKKQFYYIHQCNAESFSIAGLWDEWLNPVTGDRSRSFVMLTIEANEVLREVHNSGQNPFRMPLIIPRSSVEGWLDPTLTEDQIKQFLIIPPADEIVVWPVRLKFQYGDPYDPTKTEEVPPVDGQLKLFDKE